MRLEEIQEQIDSHKKNIKLVKENMRYEEKKLKIQMKYPKPLNPKFEFEIRDEYIAQLKKTLQFEWDKKKEDMNNAIEAAKKEIEEMELLKKEIVKTKQGYIS
jgi:hypothetical protein|tara:strand:- start:374 stop:682 length:309 start_codon:yes stop_codon:yes gene_type:complete